MCIIIYVNLNVVIICEPNNRNVAIITHVKQVATNVAYDNICEPECCYCM